jgi:ornithine decarboxylase
MYEQNPVDLPANLVEGDSIDFLAAGAYTAPCSSVGFNGMPPLNEIFLD